MNCEQLSTRLDIPTKTISNKLNKAGYKVVNGSVIPEQWIAFVCDEYKKKRQGRSGKTNRAAADILKHLSTGAKAAAIISGGKQEAEQGFQWDKFFALLPLPMLGVVASYAVFLFAGHFVDFWVQFFEAASFETIYISLAALMGKLSEDKRKFANNVALAAFLVSATYGTMAYFFELEPEFLTSLNTWGNFAVAALHAVPITALGFFTAKLLLHK